MDNDSFSASVSPISGVKMPNRPVLAAYSLCRSYELHRGFFSKSAYVHAVRDISFTLRRGRTLAIVGESGCGKSTLARMVTMIERPDSGYFTINGVDPNAIGGEGHKDLHRRIQIVFQNPYGSLNPRQKVGNAIGEPLLINTSMSREKRIGRVFFDNGVGWFTP